MGTSARLHPGGLHSVEHLLLAAHPALFLYIKTSNDIVLLLFLKYGQRNQTAGCISHAVRWLLSVWGTLQAANSLWEYNMYTAMQFLCAFIPQSLAEHNSDHWCHDYSCQMSHGGFQAFCSTFMMTTGSSTGQILQKKYHCQQKKWKSARILASVSEQNLQFRTFWAIVITKAAPSLLILICEDLDLSLSFSTLELLMNLLWAKPEKLETYITQSLSHWFWVQTHSYRKSCENNLRHCKKKRIFFQLPLNL